jgi:hypothetical protein
MSAQGTEFGGKENLQLKIALGSYRLFFVPGTTPAFDTQPQLTVYRD